MRIFDRFAYALIGFVFGAVLGVVCWWLYGLGLSLRMYGPGIDPSLRHWIMYVGLAFAVLGFMFQEGVGDAVGSVLNAIFDFEEGLYSRRDTGIVASLFLLALIGFAIWFVIK
jgi:hypothetical protein